MSDFIKLNDFYVKDKIARELIDVVNVNIEDIDQEIINIKNDIYGYIDDKEGKIDGILDAIDKIEEDITEIKETAGEAGSNIESLLGDKHNHANKDALDELTFSKMEAWTNKSDFSGNYEDLVGAPETWPYDKIVDVPELEWEDIKDLLPEDYVTGVIPTKVSAFENDVPYFYENDIVNQESIDYLIDLFEFKINDTPDEGEEPAEEPLPPEYEEGSDPIPDDYVEYGVNLIKNGRFAGATANSQSIPHWTMRGNVQVDATPYHEVTEYLTLLLLDKEESYIEQVVEDLAENTVYTLSFDISWESAVSDYSVLIEYYDDADYMIHGNAFIESDPQMGEKFVTITTPDISFSKAKIAFEFNGLSELSSTEANVFLYNVKLEEGFDQTGWTEHPDL